MATPTMQPLAQAVTLSDLVLSTPSTEPAAVSARLKRLNFTLDQLRLLREKRYTVSCTSGTATAFRLFPNLPVELRIKIFAEVLSEQEIFAIGWDSSQHGSITTWDPIRVTRWCVVKVHGVCVTGKGSLLRVDAEARAEAVKVLQLFEVQGRKTWYNTSTDAAWVAKFATKDDGAFHEGFLIDHSLQSLTIRYTSWTGSPEMP